MSTPEPTVAVTQYTVSTYPNPDSINASLYDVSVEYRGKGMWAVCWMGRCYDRKGVADYEPIPSSRTDKWLKRFRFADVEMALAVAKQVAPTIVVNGKTAADTWAWEQERTAGFQGRRRDPRRADS